MEPETDHDVSSLLLAPGKDEMNFAEHPIALLTDRVPKGQRSLIYEDTVYSQRRKKMVPRKRVIEGSQEYGLPTATDDTMILGLIQLTKLKNQFKQRDVEFTRLELIEMLGWTNEGKNYERCKLSLMRIKGVQYFYDNAWWDARLKDWTTRAFSIIDNVEINDSRIVDGQGGLFPSRITWNEVVFESFQAGFLRNIDFQLCMRLKHPTSLRMYRYLGKQFYAKTDLVFELKAFAEANLGLGRNYEGGTQIARKLKPAIKELEEVGFLEPMAEDGLLIATEQKTTIFTVTDVQLAGGAVASGVRLKPCLDLEAVLAVRVDVFVAGRREPGDVLLVHRLALGPELLDHRGHVDRVPGHHRVGHQVQAARLVPQLLLLLLPERALVGEQQELPQAVQGLALVELGVDPPPVVPRSPGSGG